MVETEHLFRCSTKTGQRLKSRNDMYKFVHRLIDSDAALVFDVAVVLPSILLIELWIHLISSREFIQLMAKLEGPSVIVFVAQQHSAIKNVIIYSIIYAVRIWTQFLKTIRTEDLHSLPYSLEP